MMLDTANAGSPLPSVALVRAEILKLVTRRGLMVAALVLAVGTTLATYALLELLHLGNPAKHGPAGGTHNFSQAMWLITQLGSIAAILIGGTAGAGDAASGFFRTLVVTGRSRAALFAARIPSGLGVVLALAAIDYAIVAAATAGFAGNKPTPSMQLYLHTGAWVIVYLGVVYLVALGLGSLLGSRSTTIAVLVGLQLAITPILQGVHGLYGPREAILGVAIWQLAPKIVQTGAPHSDLAMSHTAAAAVLAVWAVAALTAGCWKTLTRDA
jgi:ABC-type transport system involved in multi-copper enzyme maturation permease subunit